MLDRTLLDNQTDLEELVGLPQLMEKCVNIRHYNESLELYNYASWLYKRHPDVGLLKVSSCMRLAQHKRGLVC